MKPITVLIVDDSALIRKLYSDLLHDAQDINVIGVAVNAQDAREKIKQMNPDVLTLDIEMPGMDGLSFLEKIMSLRPMPVIMISTLTQKGAGETLRALELGAVDYISKPTGAHSPDTLQHLREELISKIQMAVRANLKSHSNAGRQKKTVLPFLPAGGRSRHIIAIGSSTGGVEALRDIFMMLPANCPPIVIAQHMPEQFTPSFAARLHSISQVDVSEAKQGARLMQGYAYLAPGNQHLKIIRRGSEYICQLEESPLVSGHRPSVDVLFHSVAQAAGSQAVGVILTGMGKDGAAGLLKMRENGAYTIGQNENSCVVYGMPKAAMMLGAVQAEFPLLEIPAQLLAYCEKEKAGKHAV